MKDDQDLGALFARITQRLLDAERPLLARHDLSMWAYIVLCQLAVSPAGTQLALARQIGYDKTRLIKLLDGLSEAGLIERRADPEDRRAHVVALTAAGQARVAAARSDIRAMEDQLLSGLSASHQRSLRRLLAELASDTSSPDLGRAYGPALTVGTDRRTSKTLIKPP